MKIQDWVSTKKILILTKASTTKSMWATPNSNPYESPTHTNKRKQCSCMDHWSEGATCG